MAKLSLFAAALLSAAVVVSSITTQEFIKSLELKQHSDTAHGDRFLLCSDMPGNNSLQVTFFGITNTEAFKAGANAVVKEYSPLLLKPVKQKTKCSANVDDFQINVNLIRGWTFTSGDLNQRITTANIPFVRLGRSLCNSAESNGECLADLVAAGEGYLTEDVTLSDLIHGINVEHYSSFISEKGHTGRFSELQKSTFSVMNEIHANFPKKISMNSNSDKFGDITYINEQDELTWWKSDKSDPLCYKLAGTAGDVFNGRITPESVLHYYSDDLCGLSILQFDSIDTSYGFEAYKFVMHTSSIHSQCYCPYGNCLPTGVIDVHPCQGGLPLVMSLPHFYEADSSFREGAVGSSPNPDLHQTYFIIEPTTGMVIESSQKLQVNVDLRTFNGQGNWQGKDIQSTILPLFWFDRKYELDDTHVKALQQMFNNPTTSTPTPEEPVTDMKEIGNKLNDISSQLTIVSTLVVVFVVLVVVLMLSLGFKTYFDSRLRRAHHCHRTDMPAPPYTAK